VKQETVVRETAPCSKKDTALRDIHIMANHSINSNNKKKFKM